MLAAAEVMYYFFYMKNILTIIALCCCLHTDANPFAVNVQNTSAFRVSVQYANQTKRVLPNNALNLALEKDGLIFIYVFNNKDSLLSDYTYNLFDPGTGSRKITIQSDGSAAFQSSNAEKAFADLYRKRYADKNSIDFKAFVTEHKNDLSSVEAIFFFKCNSPTSKNEILELFNLVSAEMKQSTQGKDIQDYLWAMDNLRVGNTFRDFSLPQLSKDTISLYNIKSKYILVDFWFSSCGPCVRAFPDLKELYQETSRNTLEIVGISVDSESRKWQYAIEDNGLGWINVLDKQYTVSYKTYAIDTYPTTVLINNSTKKIIAINPSIEDIKVLIQ